MGWLFSWYFMAPIKKISNAYSLCFCVEYLCFLCSFYMYQSPPPSFLLTYSLSVSALVWWSSCIINFSLVFLFFLTLPISSSFFWNWFWNILTDIILFLAFSSDSKISNSLRAYSLFSISPSPTYGEHLHLQFPYSYKTFLGQILFCFINCC